MNLKTAFAVLFASMTLVACGESESGEDLVASSVESEISAKSESKVLSEGSIATTSELPPVCLEYFETVERFAAQYPDLGASYQGAMEDIKMQIESVDGDVVGFESTCQDALDAFTSSITNMPQ